MASTETDCTIRNIIFSFFQHHGSALNWFTQSANPGLYIYTYTHFTLCKRGGGDAHGRSVGSWMVVGRSDFADKTNCEEF